MTTLEPDENGNYICPYCTRTLISILREWLRKVTDYICHWCQIGFKVVSLETQEKGMEVFL